MRTPVILKFGFCICFHLFLFNGSSAQKLFDKIKKTVKDVSSSAKKINNDIDETKKNVKNTNQEANKFVQTTGLGKKNIPKTEKEKNDSIAGLSKMIGPDEELVYYNDFSFEDNIWKSFDNKNTYRPIRTEVNNGEYSLFNGTDNPVWSVKELGLDLNRNFIIETSVALVSGNESENFGINFAQRGNYYPNNAVGINLKGYFSIFERSTSIKVINFIDFSAATSIVKEKKAYNKIRIEKIGRKINLIINDVIVNEGIAWNTPLKFYGNYLGFYAGPSQEIRANYFLVKYLNGKQDGDQPFSSAKTNFKPPVIKITEPKLSAGINKMSFSGKSMIIAGNVTSDDAVYLLEVNGTEVPLDDKGNFTAYYPLESGSNKIKIVAKDGSAKTGTYELVIDHDEATRKADPPVPVRGVKINDKNSNAVVTAGNYYALILAAQNYKDDQFPLLQGPIKDASALVEVLTDKYNFEEKKVLFIKDPTRVEIFRALDSVRRLVTKNDNLLIFYAGHGAWKEEYKEGYWAPVDAGPSSQYSMISNSEIKSAIHAINSKHTLLITDACFAGGLLVTRSSLADASKAIVETYKLPSRKAITSGTLTVVPDKSVFMEYLLKRLRDNEEKYLTALTLFSSFSQAVTNNSPNAQLPQYGTIQQTGDEGGDFIFIKK